MSDLFSIAPALPVRSTIVRLSPGQMDYAAFVGAWRRIESYQAARRQAHGQIAPFETHLANDILGARGELAAKIYLDPIRWNARTPPRRADGSTMPDLECRGLEIDVKAIRKEHHSLIVQKHGPDNWAYPLVDGSAAPDFLMVGWLWGYEAKQDKWWDTKGWGPAFYVPQSALWRTPAELLAEVRDRDG